MLLEIKNYSLKITELNKDILDNADLAIDKGDIIVLQGKNGSGKSSFIMSLLGLSAYSRSGTVKIDGEESIDKSIDEIARMGLFVSFQSPPDIEGVSLYEFLSTAYRAIYPEDKTSSFKLRKEMIKNAEMVGLNKSFLERETNRGFSGGERRKSEVLQMLTLKPKIAVLDEVDSGLDVESRENIAKIINDLARGKEKERITFLIVSHSNEFIDLLKPDYRITILDKKLVEK